MKKRSLYILALYSLVAAAGIYLLPLLIKDTGSGMLTLLILIPLLVLASSAVYGALCGISLYPPLITGLLFTPAIFIYFNSSAWVYAPIYALLSFAGCAIGRGLKKI